MEKEKFIATVSQELDKFLEFVENSLLKGFANAKTKIQQQQFKAKIQPYIAMNLAKLQEIFMHLGPEAAAIGIFENDQDAYYKQIVVKFQDVAGKIMALDIDKLQSKRQMREKEPITNLGPIGDIKTTPLTREQIDDKIIDLGVQRNKSISETEKQELEKQIVYWERLKQESSLKFRRKVS